MYYNYSCSCGNKYFEVYHSRDLLVCRECKKEHTISKITKEPIKIQHQRG